MVKMTQKEYGEYVKKMSPNSPILKNCVKAFLIGGGICVIGQLIMNGFTALGMGKTDAGSATSIAMIFLGALFTGLHLYDRLAKHAGAGTIVPITGFANSVVSPALEFQSEGYIMGTSAKIFTIAGPVIVFGVTAAIVYGVILVLFGLA